MIAVAPEKADAMRALAALYEQVATEHGQAYANAMMDALAKGAQSGMLDGCLSDAEGVVWLRARVAAILEQGDADATP